MNQPVFKAHNFAIKPVIEQTRDHNNELTQTVVRGGSIELECLHFPVDPKELDSITINGVKFDISITERTKSK